MLIYLLVGVATLSILWGGIVFGKRGKLNELFPYLLLGILLILYAFYTVQKELARYRPIGTMEVSH